MVIAAIVSGVGWSSWVLRRVPVRCSRRGATSTSGIEDSGHTSRGSWSDSGDVECPYPGLAAFTTEQSRWFFGREALTADVVERAADCLDEGHQLVVVAPSGAGKSSLLRAGLLAAISRRALPIIGSARWPQVVLTPGDRPVDAFVRALAVGLGLDVEQVGGWAASPDAFAESLTAHLDGRRVVVVVDQLEELFTLCGDDGQRRSFLYLLDGITDSGGLVVHGLRIDAYARCVAYPSLRKALQDNQVLVGPMTENEIRQAIVFPARHAGLDVEPGLVDLLLHDLGDEVGRLPLLAHALRTVWRERHGHLLTVAGYRAAGGIRNAVARTAERVHLHLDDTGRAAAQALFLRLVKIGDGADDARRTLPVTDLTCDPAVLDAFTDARLLTRDEHTVTITHEALLRVWPRLRGWIDDDRAGNLLHQKLDEAALAWEREDCDEALLWRGSRLAATAAWVERARAPLTPREREFLERSTESEARERRSAQRRRHLVLLAVVALLGASTAIAVPVVRQQRLAERIEASRNLAARAADTRAEAATNALSAYAAYPTVEARGRVLTTAAIRQGEHRRLPRDDDYTTAAISPDGRLVARRGADKVVLLATETLQEVGRFAVSAEPGTASDILFTPDGATLVVGEFRSSITFVRVADLQQVRRVDTRFQWASGFALSPDGRTLAATGTGPGVRLWDATTGSSIGDLDAGEGSDVSPAFSDDNRTLAVSDGQGAVELWDLPTRSRTARLPVANGGSATRLAFTPGGALLIVGDEGGEVVVWDVLTSSRVAVAARHAGGVYGVAVSWDGRTLATTGEDNRLALWDVRRRAPQPDLPVDRTRTQHRGLSGLWRAAFARDGTLIAFDSTDTFLWRAEQIPGDAGSEITDLGFEGSGTLRTLDESGVLTTWRTDPELRRTDRRRLADGPLAGRFGPGGTRLVLGAAGQPVTVHDVHSGQAIPLSVSGWPAPEASTRIAAFAGDGRSVVAVTTSQPIVVWNTDRPTSTRPVATQAESDQITGVGFVARDASRLAVAWIDGSITVTDPGNRTDRLLGHREPAQALAPTPDGSILATAGADPEVILWNTSAWSEIGRLSGHTAAVWRAEVSPDGKLLATGSTDGTIILWDLATRSRWATLTGQPGPVTALDWSPDSTTLATAGADSTITVWPVDPTTAVDRLCRTLAPDRHEPPCDH